MHFAIVKKLVHKITFFVPLGAVTRSTALAWFLTFLTCFLLANTLITSDWPKFNIYNVSSSFSTLNDPKEIIKQVTGCNKRSLISEVQQRGNFWILLNYVTASRTFDCSDSITYTTHGDYTFLDNVEPLIERWRGPVSLAIYAPGYDFLSTLKSIAYLRNCQNALIKEFVTFHLIFNDDHMPVDGLFSNLPSPTVKMYIDEYNCSLGSPFQYVNNTSLYKTVKRLTYPINVARNIAKEAAQTNFVLASDIELYPTPDFIPKFLLMMSRKRELLKNCQRKVFVLPVFEVLKNESLPQNKTELKTMLRSKRAFPFHKKLCPDCHMIPNTKGWLRLEDNNDLDVFFTAKRQGPQKSWEPFYVGTREDPMFDERLSWEGQSNKMTQAYTMCLLDYDFDILDNAFLVHKPGVKTQKLQLRYHSEAVISTNKLAKYIKKQLISIYGSRTSC